MGVFGNQQFVTVSQIYRDSNVKNLIYCYSFHSKRYLFFLGNGASNIKIGRVDEEEEHDVSLFDFICDFLESMFGCLNYMIFNVVCCVMVFQETNVKWSVQTYIALYHAFIRFLLFKIKSWFSKMEFLIWHWSHFVIDLDMLFAAGFYPPQSA